MNNALIFPVGHYLGANHPGEQHIVRIGWQQYELKTGDELAVWALAHGVPGTAGTPWTRATTEAVALAGGIAEAAAVLDQLLGRDLLVEVEPRTADAAAFARTCRIRSLLVGSGEHPSAPGRYGLGAVPANPTARVDGFSYELWMWAPACDSLWQACEYFARAEAGADADGVNAEPALDRVLPAAQLLLANGAAYLDEAREA
ncbi:hypothetical protein EV651_11128 [Kribbella sp. VKM Ac-2571]|uniref:hypothetical protein n=1 Tax=Kribbella sp. VKM Ac-2571 TaxID=2512222 RepID=UPI00105D1A8A|nr:hypothetical protein [Kribbella sp. VKM Ac-2571]TDO57304.1 hypothetical protein EV651_11128 [Kribbella sp. VKM Ac-2571]